MGVKLSAKKKEKVLDRQGKECVICGSKLRKGKTYFHEISESEDTALPTLEQSKDIPSEIKALCEVCHYEQEIEEKVRTVSPGERKKTTKFDVVTTGGMTIKVKDQAKQQKKK